MAKQKKEIEGLQNEILNMEMKIRYSQQNLEELSNNEPEQQDQKDKE